MMTMDYSKVWNVMNDLEMSTSKIVSAREIIDVVGQSIQEKDYERAEIMATAAYEFLGYYLEEFDTKFRKAWDETVKKINNEKQWNDAHLQHIISNLKTPRVCDKDDSSPECKKDWTDFWEETYYPEEHSKYYYDYTRNDINRESPFKDKVKKWVLPVEETKIAETDETEYFVSFPDDLLEAADLKEGDQVEWVDKGDGSYLLRKATKSIGIDEC